MNKLDSKLREELIIKNLRLAYKISKKYVSPIHCYDDLKSIGIIGLIKAIDSFDEGKSCKLSTYAGRCIENEILMYLRSEKKRYGDISLNETLGSDKDGNLYCLMDFLESENVDYIDNMDKKAKLIWLKDNLKSTLTPTEYEIIVNRYGLFGKKILTQNELSGMLGISRSYISRIEKGCLNKLKASLEKAFI